MSSTSSPKFRRTLSASLLLLSLAVSSCASEAPSAQRIQVVAGLYPLAYAAERVGGERVDVLNLTPVAGHAHELELTARQVAAVTEADLVLHIASLQPALDEAIALAPAGQEVIEALSVVDSKVAAPTADTHADEHGHDHSHDHGSESAEALDGDPHMWLDPLEFSALVSEVAKHLTELEPKSETLFAENAANLQAELAQLDDDFHAATEKCDLRTLIVGHEAYGYLAQSYGFEQVGVSGISPESEPSPARLAEVAKLVKSIGATTVYSESALDQKVAQTIAEETGANVLVLSPLESLADDGDDYFSVMRANLQALRQGQGCK